MQEVKKGVELDGKKLEYVYASMVGEEEFRKVEGYITILTILGGWFSLGLESLVRHDFGTRYFNLLKVTMASIVLFFYILFSVGFHEIVGIYAGIIRPQQPPFWLLFVFLLLACVHLGRIWYRDSILGVPWHSNSFGVSVFQRLIHINISSLKSRSPFLSWLPDMPFTDWSLYRFVEPLICLMVGQVLIWMDASMLGTWVVVSSFILSIKNNMMYAKYRRRILDVKDAQIEQAYISASLEGKSSKRQMAGCHAVPLTTQERNYRLHPGADGMLDRVASQVMGKKDAARSSAFGPRDMGQS